ncbi:acetyltransferase [mine drainage metagenome]|uniref:Acetyltransferase n=1 Tax=mine drainage metagenome TaxID=410659 RepID=T1BCV6_9ZZZZ
MVSAYRHLLGDHLDDGYAEHLGNVEGRVESSSVWVAKVDRRLVGCVTFVDDMNSSMAEGLLPNEAEIRMLAVSSEAQGRGIGKKLVSHCLDLANETPGIEALFLHTTPFMLIAQRIYASMGFERITDRDLKINDDLTLLAYIYKLARS